MMWKLTSKKTGEEFYILNEKERYNVGRSGTDLNLKGDSSISRAHASLYPCQDHVILIDTGSKYGTFCNHNIENKIAIEKNTKVELKTGERVRFGILENEWILSKIRFTTMTSSLKDSDKPALEKSLKALNVQISKHWTPKCTHLTMSEITVTAKVLYALIEQIPIVSCAFWSALLTSVQHGNADLPKVEDYTPKPSESFLNIKVSDLTFNENRKTLFSGKTFVFMGRKHVDMYGPIVEKAGASYRDLNTGVTKSFLIKKDVIVVQYIPSTQSQGSQTINTIGEYVESHGKRLIPEYEIGLAIIHCSIENFCDPSVKILPKIVSRLSTCPDLPDSVTVEETPLDGQANNFPNTNVEIPESANRTTATSDTCSSLPPSDLLVLESEVPAAAHPESAAPNELPPTEPYMNVRRSKRKISKEMEPEHPPAKKNTGPINKRKSRNVEQQPAKKMHEEPKPDEFDFAVSKSPEATVSRDDIEPEHPPAKRNTGTSNKRKSILVEEQPAKKIYEEPKSDEFDFAASSCPRASVSGGEIPSSKSTKITVSTQGFLDTSTIRRPPVTSEDVSKTADETPQNPKKRGRLALTSNLDGDSDNDDLFNFGNSPKKTKPTQGFDSDDGQDDGLFTFREPSQKGTSSSQSRNPQIQVNKPKSVTLVDKSRILPPTPVKPKWTHTPMKITTDGWLSSSLCKMRIKDEKSELKTDDEADGTCNKTIESDWADSIKDGFEVRVKVMNLTSRLRDISSTSEVDSTATVSSSGNGKNFKAFVKKCNYKPQREVISTVPVQIIAENMF